MDHCLDKQTRQSCYGTRPVYGVDSYLSQLTLYLTPTVATWVRL